MDLFIDEARVQLEAGKGGSGCVSFRREKYVEFGGPNGGDGGDGGTIYVQGSKNVQMLVNYKKQYYYKAKKGGNGEGKGCYGKAGDDVVLKLPIGTIVYDEQTGYILADIQDEEQKIPIARGGKGGKGNVHFKSSTNRAPKIAEPGKPGQVRKIRLELKILADVGLIGFPNAGKSTFITKISNSSSEVAAYPFSTLRPFLGVVHISDWERFVVADIPGIIEGASEGKGIGLRFLKHIERSKVYVFVIDMLHEDIAQQFDILRQELFSYNPLLLERPFIVALNKGDLFDEQTVEEKKQEFINNTQLESSQVFTISALKKTGVQELINVLFNIVKTTQYQDPLSMSSRQHIKDLEEGWNDDSDSFSQTDNSSATSNQEVEVFWEFAAGKIKKKDNLS